MYPVCLIKFAFGRDSFEEEWKERNFVLVSEIREGVDVIPRIITAHGRRSEHPAKQDFHVSRLGFSNNLIEVRLHLCDRHRTQKIVCAKLKDQDLDILLSEHPISPL